MIGVPLKVPVMVENIWLKVPPTKDNLGVSSQPGRPDVEQKKDKQDEACEHLP